MIPAFDSATGALPPGDHRATLQEIGQRFGFTPRRRWLLKGLHAAVEALRGAGIEEIYIGGSFCTEKPDPGDIDGYWVEPDPGVYERIDPYWIDFEPVLAPHVRKWKWRMWADHGVEFFIHPAMRAGPEMGFPEFFRRDRGRPAAGSDSTGQGGTNMIKSDAQRERTIVQLDGFRKALAQAEGQMPGKRAAVARASYDGMIRQLEDEVREYDRLKSGELAFPPVQRLDQIAGSVVKLRIAKGVSQTELARRLGLSKQVISRYEESDYQTVGIGRLQEILDELGIRTQVTLSA